MHSEKCSKDLSCMYMKYKGLSLFNFLHLRVMVENDNITEKACVFVVQGIKEIENIPGFRFAKDCMDFELLPITMTMLTFD